jgi:hypothetical protein
MCLIQSAKLNGHDPHRYMNHVVEKGRRPQHPSRTGGARRRFTGAVHDAPESVSTIPGIRSHGDQSLSRAGYEQLQWPSIREREHHSFLSLDFPRHSGR